MSECGQKEKYCNIKRHKNSREHKSEDVIHIDGSNSVNEIKTWRKNSDLNKSYFWVSLRCAVLLSFVLSV